MVDDMLTPEWRVVPDFPDYEVSNLGVIRRCVAHRRFKHTQQAGYIISQWLSLRRVVRKDGHITDLGYMCVTLYNHSIKFHKNFLCHRLVMYAFHGNPPTEKHQSAHCDGNRLNNRADNLRWATGSENQLDRGRHGTHNKGSRHPMSKLHENDIYEIRRQVCSGRKCAAIAKDYFVSEAVIINIRDGKSWKHVI